MNNHDYKGISGFQERLEKFPCDLCGKSDEEYLSTKNGTLTGSPFRVVRCRNCGLIYLNPRFNDDEISRLYDKNYYDGKGFDSNANYFDDFDKECDIDKGFRPEETVRIIKEIAPPPSLLLDFGCGIGDLMRQASKYGYKAEGYEVSHFAADFAISNGFKVYSNLDKLPKEKYDIVTAIEVLEHCSSPMKVLQAIHHSLKPGGYFYYSTANFDGFHKKWRLGLMDNALDGYILPEGHIHFFSSSVMKSYFKKIGFSRSFNFEPKTYRRGRLYNFLLNYRLINRPTDYPVTFLQKLAYYGGIKVANLLGVRLRLLPLARK